MNTQTKVSETVGVKILKLVWKAFPFVVTVLTVGIIILFLGSTITAKKEELAAQQSKENIVIKPLTNVVTLEIIPDMIMEKLSLPGVAKPWISLEIVSEIRGKIVNKKITKGRHVKNGDILAVIDKGDYQNTYDSALASYESAFTTQKRLKELVKKNFVTKSNLDDADALVKTTKAALENAKLNLNRCFIRSPMKGVVNRVYIENGKFLDSGDPVVQILQIDRLKIEVGIPESDVDAVRKLKNFNITIDALKGKTCKGNFHYLYKTTDSNARLYKLEIKVDNLDGQILPDMFARVEIVKHQDPKGIAVPMYSLVNVDNRAGVYTESNGIVHFQPVLAGFQSGWQTQIKEGLNAGDRVVVVGHRIIDHGQKVNVVKNIMDIKALTR